MSSPRILVILGPTASGKTRVAIDVADRVGGEVISADSRQAYRGLEVGTAAPTETERARVPHHGIGFLEPGQRYGAGRFARLARNWIDEIEGRGHVPIVAGGTGLFVRALTNPVFREPDLEPERRASLEGWLSERPLDELRRWTARMDPALTNRLAVLDRQRAARSLELALMTGRALSWWQRHGTPEAEPVEARIWVLELDPESLRARIGERTERLLDGGWRDEVEELARAGHDAGSPSMTSIGYRSVWDLVHGRVSRQTAVEAILRDTWRYARRQRTWLRHQLPRDAVRIDASAPASEIAARIASEWDAAVAASG